MADTRAHLGSREMGLNPVEAMIVWKGWVRKAQRIVAGGWVPFETECIEHFGIVPVLILEFCSHEMWFVGGVQRSSRRKVSDFRVLPLPFQPPPPSQF